MSEFDDILLETSKIDLDIDKIISDQNPINLNYDQLKHDLSTVRDKSTIQQINRTDCSLDKLEANTFDGFHYLIDLNLSHNILMSLPRGVFDQLLNLKTINLSHNLIFELEDSVFTNNKQLMIINLSNNSLNKINSSAFYNLPILLKLDFSYNRIESLSEKCVASKSLEELNLSNNLIQDLHIISLWFVPNLINLQLNNNKISVLNENIFKTTTQIENLNFSNNLIQKLDKKTLFNLNNLKQADFSNNFLATCGKCFDNKPLLTELNLLNNRITNFRLRDFAISENIRKLKLTIHETHKLEIFKTLKKLSDFEFHVKSEKIFALRNNVLPWINESSIQRIYMVIRKGKFNITNEISNFVNLEFLHIKFLEPNDHSARFNIKLHMKRMRKLEHLALININKLKIIGMKSLHDNNLTYLDLTGIDNVFVEFLRYNFIKLEYLKLSESQVKNISRYWMASLPNLKYLIMNNTGITVIEKKLFQYNIKLEIIDFKDCEIHTIGEKAFRNLINLQEIDIRGNTKLRITQSLLNGIPKSAVVYYD